MLHVFILKNIPIPIVIYSFLIFISLSNTLTLIMLRGAISHLSQVGLIEVISRLIFGMFQYSIKAMILPTRADNLKIGCNT
jgi:hypothetical protein